MDFFDDLSLKYNSLTKNSKLIADFIKIYKEDVVKMTAQEIGNSSKTSPASVIRFCKQLGYDSLTTMKIAIAKSLNVDDLTYPIDNMITNEDSISIIQQKLYNNTNYALQETLKILGTESIKKSIEYIKKAKRVFLFGVGSSGLAALDLSHKLNRIGKICLYSQDSHTNLEFSTIADKKDIIIAFSFSGETKEAYLAAKWGHEKGVKVISVTRDRASTLSAYSDIILKIPEIEKRVRIGAFGSKFAQMFLADLLYLGVIQKDYHECEKILLNVSKIVNKLRD